MRIQIYCPECLKKGSMKHLMDADSNAVGVIYPYCKVCHKNVAITLAPEIKRKPARTPAKIPSVGF